MKVLISPATNGVRRSSLEGIEESGPLLYQPVRLSLARRTAHALSYTRNFLFSFHPASLQSSTLALLSSMKSWPVAQKVCCSSSIHTFLNLFRRTLTTMTSPTSSSVMPAENPAKRVKLTGRAFYESIGSPKMIVAPMVDRSEFVSLPLTHAHRLSQPT